MSHLIWHMKRSTLPVLVVVCLAALTASFAYAEGSLRPLAEQVIGDPDARVAGKLTVNSATPGAKALNVAGVIDFTGDGTVHNYFTQGPGNNLQIRANVDNTNTVGDPTKKQWSMVMGSASDVFSIRHSPASGTYNEDALFFINGSTGRVGIATVDTGNGSSIPFTPQARLHVQTASGDAVRGVASATSGTSYGVYGQTDSTTESAAGVYGTAAGTSGDTYGVHGANASTEGGGVVGIVSATTGHGDGVVGVTNAPLGSGVIGYAASTTGVNYGVKGISLSPDGYAGFFQGIVRVEGILDSTWGVRGQIDSTDGTGVYGLASATTGLTYGVYGQSDSTAGRGVAGYATATSGDVWGVYGESSSPIGAGVYGRATATTGTNGGVVGSSDSPSGQGVVGFVTSTSGTNYGVVGYSGSPSGYGVYSYGRMHVEGDLSATGTKSAIVETEDYGWRHLYAMESPKNWFEDFGEATLSGGEVVVSIEEIFAQTVNLDETYHVFLTPLGGGCTLFVVDRSSEAFTVRANEGSGCEIAFDYRIIAPRLEYEDLRLKEAENPEAIAASVAPP